nr:hypothetical protein [uncultured Sphingomonas sp.]
MTDRPSVPIPTFFLLRAAYDLEQLVLLLGDGTNRPLLEVVFTLPRAFRSFAESDYHLYLGAFEGRPLIFSADPGCGIELSGDAPYLLDYRANARVQESEETFSCLIRTPDHCVEVICFEEPALRYF